MTRKKQKGNKKIGKIGKEIMTQAKKIKKSNPNICWTDCVKKAGKKYKKVH